MERLRALALVLMNVQSLGCHHSSRKGLCMTLSIVSDTRRVNCNPLLT